MSGKRKSKSSEDIVNQMVDAIAGKATTEKDKTEQNHQAEMRKKLEGRAWEYLMFMDDGD